MSNVTPFLWFDNRAEDAANFYVSTFKNSKVHAVSRYQEDTPGTAGSVMTVTFELDGQRFIALNGGPVFAFTSAISFLVNCETQADVDHLWERLSDGGTTSRCGWLTDKFGVTWQIVPSILPELLGSDNEERSGRAMQAMLQMEKLDIAALQRAYDGD